ncbi:Gfo/Idh/MocA family protein [Novipirellula artificiosorum]|uniref:1,5-anhydro-D-fructose reductase n=1 Tax=Novipirellula artificiosorum TaxID=2528016 RepID=A0A5C6D7F3_9BACT|nr:Gfo/Idh/MocA family oxidoreductase [Novipirellula artificiosorum]TWU31176.1 1,5-anhydro-D-fructose reductase [Novipirellula artificiosorum]
MNQISRRQMMASATALTILGTSSAARAGSVNDRLNVAFIGVGNQGMGLLKRFLAADLGNVAMVCDVNRGSYGYKEEDHFYGREPARDFVNDYYTRHRGKGNYNTCTATEDWREVIARDDIDAVWLVVPDHWHRPMAVTAAAAGKAIYCEKPQSLTIADGQAMVAAVREHGVVLQTGSHERSNPVSQFICEAAKAGKIGPIRRVVTTVGYNNKVGPGPGWKAEPVPDGFDYQTWLGNAPKVPYHHDRCLYRFRFNYDYSGGQITNFGAHSNDMAQWGLGRDLDGPVSIQALEAKFLPEGSLFNTATETKFRCVYEDGVELICQSGPEQVQTRFEGEDGWLQTGYRGTTASSPNLLDGLPEKPSGTDDVLTRHMRNFLDCVRTGDEPRAYVEVGHSTASLCHIGNIAIRRHAQHGDQTLDWDPKKQTFAQEDANDLLTRNRA